LEAVRVLHDEPGGLIEWSELIGLAAAAAHAIENSGIDGSP
jgi:hypothetical protein